MKIKKAIFPVGGLGTRFLPATKSMPKEMLPIVAEQIAERIGIFVYASRAYDEIAEEFDDGRELDDNTGKPSKAGKEEREENERRTRTPVYTHAHPPTHRPVRARVHARTHTCTCM